MDSDKLTKIQKMLLVFSVLIMGGCFLFMGIEDSRNDKSQIIINISEENTTVEATENIKENDTVTTKITETEKTDPKATDERATEAVKFPIDINAADEEDLMYLTGIGEVLSAEIVKYRDENGNFNNIEEIMDVPGIGVGIFNNIMGHIYVENPVYPTETAQIEPEYEEENEVENIITLEDVMPIELNSADAELLMLLPYVDEEIAGEIIELRVSIGEFSHPYELLYVNGLTQQQVAEIVEYVYVEGD